MVPQYSKIETRQIIDISNTFKNQFGLEIKLNLPIISSPMNTITEDKMALAIHDSGGLGIIHRYCSIEEQVEMVKNSAHQSVNVDGVVHYDPNRQANIGAAVGVKGDYLERAKAVLEAGANVLCIDIAHGFHSLMVKAIEEINKLPNRKDFILMVGNVAEGEGFKFLSNLGSEHTVDAIRVGIGGGSICSTRLNTGFGIPNASAIMSCFHQKNNFDLKPSIIIDGGIKNGGDICKSLALGADFVMIGSILAGSDETPGKNILYPGVGYVKSYNGMAGLEANKGRNKDKIQNSYSIEGISSFVPLKGPVSSILNRS